MKRIAIVLMMITAPVLAHQERPKSDVLPVVDKSSPEKIAKLQAKIAEVAGKFIYVSRDCGMPVDPEKFKNFAQLRAFSEGYTTIEGVDWETVKRDAHIKYGELKAQAPEGELCEKYTAFLKDKYQWLKDTSQ